MQKASNLFLTLELGIIFLLASQRKDKKGICHAINIFIFHRYLCFIPTTFSYIGIYYNFVEHFHKFD